MSWLNTPIPLWQLIGLITVYVLYREFIKLALKSTVKSIRRRRAARLVSAGAITVNEGRQLILCDCDCGTECPQGKVGSSPRCSIWRKL